MDGRFPFENNGGRRPPQLNAAQMRAALGLSSVGSLDEAYYLQHAAQQQQQQQQLQLQRQQELQRDLQLRQLLLQEQLDQQLQEQQLRAIGEQLQDFPDLQQHYQSLLLNERLQRQRRSSSLAGPAISSLAGTAHQQLTTVQQQQTAILQEQRLRAYDEQLLFQQQQQLQQRQLSASFRRDDMAQPSHAQSAASLIMSAAAQQQQRHQVQQHIPQLSSQHVLSQNLAAVEALAAASPPSAAVVSVPVSSVATSHAVQHLAGQHPMLERERSYSQSMEESPRVPSSRKRSHSEHFVTSATEKIPGKKKSKKKKDKRVANAYPSETPVQLEMPLYHAPETMSPSSPVDGSENFDIADPEGVFETFAMAADIRSQEEIICKGTLEDLVEAAEDCDQLDGAAMLLITKLSEVEAWSDSEVEEDASDDISIAGLKVPTTPAESVSTPKFKSALPSLPEEPVFLEDTVVDAEPVADDEANGYKKEDALERSTDSKDIPKSPKKSAILDYPYPIDTWWPSVNGMRRERKNCGETSDEDDFEEEPAPPGEKRLFRANEQNIRSRLSRALQPGVLEKLPHCRLHRIKSKRKKNSTAPELVYCWQVTELYPQEIMVNCSRCGTWMHAACGGHHKPYSTRENTETPFVAVCEHCHEEDKYLNDYPQGKQRIERQRVEQLRRALATSSVMRHSSYSKHGGTYKWPLGSVSATHIGGHTRSVHARHDKAEKQWNDMAARLGRGFGYRQKERVRCRTKELERLLVAIEDAEGFTDRHNMFLFLRRDTEKEKPAGFENENRNIFDPADDEDDADQPNDATYYLNGYANAAEAAAAAKEIMPYEDDEETDSTGTPSAVPIGMCARIGCETRQRFDSRFCSDACGVATLELSLLRTLHDASDIHPSVLRL